MKGTKLWKPAGSPLIYGASRSRRPFWRDWLIGTAVCVVGFEAALFVFGWWTGRGGQVTAFASPVAYFQALGWLVPTALVGSAFGVWLATQMGWRRGWLAGSIAGLVLSVLATPLVIWGSLYMFGA